MRASRSRDGVGIRSGVLLTLLLAGPVAWAHLGSPDTLVQAQAGPYAVLLTAHPPAAYPGAMEFDLRCSPDDHIGAATASLDGAAPVTIQMFTDGTATASLWTAAPVGHTIHVSLQGARGAASLNFPVPPAAMAPRPMRRPVLLMVAGMLLAGATVLLLRRRRWVGVGLLVAGGALAIFAIAAGKQTRTAIAATLADGGRLDFTLLNKDENFKDVMPDHGRLMHLFLVREPEEDVFLHLHPQEVAAGKFSTQLPAMPPGAYRLFADFYHADGRGETATTVLGLSGQTHAGAGDADDTFAVLPPISRSGTQPVVNAGSMLQTARLADGYAVELRTDAVLRARRTHVLRVTLLDTAGGAPADMALYLGMTAHAVILRNDNGVFAHIHPGGTLPMLLPAKMDGGMAGMAMEAVSNTASIPYSFPTPGRYRVFVQMKHGTRVETGAFDVTVI